MIPSYARYIGQRLSQLGQGNASLENLNLLICVPWLFLVGLFRPCQIWWTCSIVLFKIFGLAIFSIWNNFFMNFWFNIFYQIFFWNFLWEYYKDNFLEKVLEILNWHKYKMVTQITHSNTNTNWLHKYNMAQQIHHGDTNTTWGHKYYMCTKNTA